MRPPFIQRQGRNVRRRQERGVTLALVALAIFSIIAMAAVSIDVGTLYQASAEAQRAADAAALAAARVLSLSGMTGDPANSSVKWAAACDAATQVATAVANQNSVGGAVPSKVDVSFIGGDKGKGSNCSANTLVSFGVNPTVTVKVTQASLSTYFSRIWGRTGSSVSATATAEVFNPSNSGSYASGGSMVPVQPRCVKPWIVPNLDPGNPTGCITTPTTNCQPIVSLADGSIQHPGISLSNNGAGVIGEQFNLAADCGTSPGNCRGGLGGTFPDPSVTSAGTLQYVPGQVLGSPIAVPSCGTANVYQQAIAGCDQSTPYQCGVSSANQVDLSENPGPATGDTLTAAECLIHQASGTTTGQDALVTAAYPYQIQAGTGNPLGVSSTTVITSSNSIVSLPIYDGNPLIINGNDANVTIVGFLQVFINQVNADSSLTVTVLNVAGCGNGQTTAVSSSSVYGTSPVPIRLITPP